jgi:hypothetical protein
MSERDSVDHILSQLKSKHEQSDRDKRKSAPPDFPQPTRHLNTSNDPLDDILAELKTESNEKIKTEQQQLVAEQLRQVQHQQKAQQQRQADLKKRSEAWLAQLDPLAGEGVWFEQFARTYPSRLEAAMDFLGESHSS